MKIFCWYMIVGLSMVLTQRSAAQTNEKEKMIQLGLKQDSLMYAHLNKRDFKSALEACALKEEYFFKGEAYAKYVKARNDKAWFYHRMDSLALLKNAVFKNVELANQYLEKEDKQWIRAKEQVNSYYYILGDYKSALEVIKEVIPLKEKLNLSKSDIAITYQNLGNAYNRLRDSDNALSSFKKSLKVLSRDMKTELDLGERYNNIARTYNFRGELDSALVYLEKAEKLFDNIDFKGRYKNQKVHTYTLFVETWLKKEDFQKAKYYLESIEEIPLSNSEKVIWNEFRTKYYRATKNYELSIASIQEAIRLAEETGARNSIPSKARRQIEFAKTLIENGKDDEALIVVQQGLQILSPTWKGKDHLESPKSDQLFDKPDALILLQEKGRILNRKHKETEDNSYLNSSYRTYLIACDVIRDVRQGIRSTDSRNDLSETAISVYEEAIDVAYELSKRTGKEDFIATAFRLAESNKAQLLLENLNEQEALGYAGLPDTLRAKEHDMRIYLAALEDRALREGRESDNDEDIFNLRQELSQFTSFLESSYPRYFQLKYNNEAIDPTEIQEKLLDNSTAVIEYFVGERKIFVFLITKEAFFMDELVIKASEMNQINALRNVLRERPGSNSSESEYQEFVESSVSVYNAYVKEAMDKLPTSVSKLIVIPDDQINYIPFEVLLKDIPLGKASYALDAQSYLFEDYTVNYNYSATLLKKVMSKEESDFESNFIGYAPTFSAPFVDDARATVYELSVLKCNMDEVNAINSMMEGVGRLSDSATKENFLNEVNSYKIVHLATHAFVNQNDSKLNRIFLQDDFLSDVNLYNLELNTELAVLSACNTGSGELLKGEGVMNLARGFINAGCSSTLMSMWSVDDCATSELMQLFYEGIKNGLNKDEALRQAKITYLNSATKTKLHPYYWAAFVPFGDMKALELSGGLFSGFGLPLLLSLGFLVFGVVYLRRKSKQNS
ncbi:MAG: CHAT domain-containing tetratricopeptide repeat protein [Bacteroidota bacterium]